MKNFLARKNKHLYAIWQYDKHIYKLIYTNESYPYTNLSINEANDKVRKYDNLYVYVNNVDKFLAKAL